MHAESTYACHLPALCENRLHHYDSGTCGSFHALPVIKSFHSHCEHLNSSASRISRNPLDRQVAGGGEMQLRSSDPRFLSLVDAWWQQLLPRLAPLTYARGGPIILVQVLFQKHSCGLNIHSLLSAYGVHLAGKRMRWPAMFLHRHSSNTSKVLNGELA